MDIVRVALMASALVLGVAGLTKLRDQSATQRALAAAGWPHDQRLIRLIAGAEVALAVATLTVNSPLVPLGVMLAYLGFAAFVIAVMAQHISINSCGCFGDNDTPPSAAHVALNAVAATVALFAAVDNPTPLLQLYKDEPAKGVLSILVAGTIAASVYFFFAREVTSRGNRAAGSRPVRR